MRSIFKAVATITIFSVLTRALGFLFRIYLSRTIGAEGLGLFQISLSVFVVLESFIASGIPITVSKACSRFEVKSDKKAQSGVTTAAFIVGLSLALVLILIVLLFKNLFAGLFTDERCLIILISLLPALVSTSVYSIFRGYLWGKRNFFLVGFSEFLEQVLKIIICVVVLNFALIPVEGALGVSISLTIASVLSAIFVLIFYFVKGGKINNPKNHFSYIFKSATPITGVRVASNLIMPIIAIIIPMRLVAVGYTSEQALAQFGIALGMTFPLLYLPSTLIGSLAMAIVPEISYSLASNNKKDVSLRVESSIKFSLFVSACFLPLFLGLGEPLGEFLYNNNTAGYYLSYAAWIMIPLGINNIATSILNSLGLEARSFVNYLIGAVFLLASIFILPQYIGILSLVWGMGLCMVVAAILNIRMIKKHTQIQNVLLKNIMILTIITLPCALLASYLYGLFMYIFPQFVSLALSGTIVMLLFFAITSIFKVFSIHTYFINIIKSKKSRKPLLPQ